MILWKCSTSPPATGGQSSQPKEREKGQENSPSPLPLLGKRMKVTGVAGRPLEELPYCLPPPGTAGLNEYEIAGLAKEMERVYGTALSAETTWDVRDCETDPWPPLEDITVIAVLDGRHRGLPFEDPGRYWFDIKWSGPRAFREICVCAVRKRQ